MLAIAAMLLQQALSYLATLVFPVAIPAISQALDISLAWAGIYTGVVFLASSLGQLSCGGFIVRYGALRLSQVSLVLLGTGLMLASSGLIAAFVVSAVMIGVGNAISTPSSSHLLARYAPPRYAPLVFSIKQTGVPVGGIAAGVLVPLLIAIWDWPGAFRAIGVFCLLFALLLQPLRQEFDRGRDTRHGLTPRTIGADMTTVWRTPALRQFAIAMFCFVGLQSLYGSFFVSYLTDGLGYGLEAAGAVFATGQAIAIGARILWGIIGSKWLAPRAVLGWLGVAMAGAGITFGFFAPGWPVWAVGAAAVAYCGTAISWHGLFLSEVARLAPPGRVGPITGSVLAFGGAGMMAYPVMYSVLLTLTGDYGIGFLLGALPAVLVGAMLIRPLPPSTT